MLILLPRQYVAPVESDIPPKRKLPDRRGRVGPRGPVSAAGRNAHSRTPRSVAPGERAPQNAPRDERYRRRANFGPMPQGATDSGPSTERAVAAAYIRSRNYPAHAGHPERNMSEGGTLSFRDLMRGGFGENWQLLDWQLNTSDIDWGTTGAEDRQRNRPMTDGRPVPPQQHRPVPASFGRPRVTGTLQEAEGDSARAEHTSRPRMPSTFRMGNANAVVGVAGPRRTLREELFSYQNPHLQNRRWVDTMRRSQGYRERRRRVNESPQGPADPALNGLGDRNRSLSPEGWDTLLSTLTPDPQAPSAGSSFASTAASQSNGNPNDPSNTSLSHHAPDAEVQGEQPCEPGHENSDGEDDDMNAPSLPPPPFHPQYIPVPRQPQQTGYVTRAQEAAAIQLQSSRHDLDFISQYVTIPPEIVRRTQARVFRPGSLSEIDQHFFERDEQALESYQRRAEELHQEVMRAEIPPNAWAIQVSIGASDGPQGDESGTLHGGIGASFTASNAVSGEEELTGMQSIVSHLARRVDIPEDWWAQAGLSRTLSNAHSSSRPRRDSDGSPRDEAQPDESPR